MRKRATGVRDDQEKKSDRLRVHHEKKSDEAKS